MLVKSGTSSEAFHLSLGMKGQEKLQYIPQVEDMATYNSIAVSTEYDNCISTGTELTICLCGVWPMSSMHIMRVEFI